jgi:hypothetical protein
LFKSNVFLPLHSNFKKAKNEKSFIIIIISNVDK